MPARWTLRFEREGKPGRWPSWYNIAYDLRRWLLPGLRDIAGVTSMHGDRYAIRVLTGSDLAGDELVVSLSVAGDDIVPALDAGLRAMEAAAASVTVGRGTARVRSVALEETVPAQALVEGGPVGSLVARFATITAFSSGDRRSRAIPDPARIVKSWASSWNGENTEGGPSDCPALHALQVCPETIVAELGTHLDPVAGELHWASAHLEPGASNPRAPRTMHGFCGELSLRLHRRASPEAALWLGRLAAFAPFAGTGYHVQLGLGSTEIRSTPAGAAGPPAP